MNRRGSRPTTGIIVAALLVSSFGGVARADGESKSVLASVVIPFGEKGARKSEPQLGVAFLTDIRPGVFAVEQTSFSPAARFSPAYGPHASSTASLPLASFGMRMDGSVSHAALAGVDVGAVADRASAQGDDCDGREPGTCEPDHTTTWLLAGAVVLGGGLMICGLTGCFSPGGGGGGGGGVFDPL